MTKLAVLRHLIAGYEAAACLVGLVLLPSVLHSSSGPGATVAATVVGIFAVLAGCGAVLLWRNSPLGYALCAAGEATRVVRVVSPWLTYYAVVGLDLTLGLQVFPSGMPGRPEVLGALLWYQWFAGASFFGYVLAPSQFWALGFNVVGVAVLVGLRAAWRQNERHHLPAGPDPVEGRPHDVPGGKYVLYRSTPDGGRHRVGVYSSREAADMKRAQLSALPHSFWIENETGAS